METNRKSNAISQEDLEAFAQDIGGAVGKEADSRSRLLCVMEILRKYTDTEHGLTAGQIREIIRLRQKREKGPSENSVLGDLKAIKDNELPDFTIDIPSRGKSGGIRHVGGSLTSAQVRMLFYITKACRYITKEQCSEICEALHELLSYMEQDKVVEEVEVHDRMMTGNPDVLAAMDAVCNAIQTGKRVSFRYCLYDMEKNERFKAAPNGGELFCETPIGLLYEFNRYYLRTWSDEPIKGKHVLDRRLDRMRDISTSSIDPASNDEIAKQKELLACPKSEVFDMLGGEECEIFLKVKAREASNVYDRFGYDCRFENIKSGTSGYGYLRVRVQLSPTFFRWLAGFGGTIKIVKPKGDLWVNTGHWAKLNPNMTGDMLMKDYKKAVRKYEQFLKNAGAAIETGC